LKKKLTSHLTFNVLIIYTSTLYTVTILLMLLPRYNEFGGNFSIIFAEKIKFRRKFSEERGFTIESKSIEILIIKE